MLPLISFWGLKIKAGKNFFQGCSIWS